MRILEISYRRSTQPEKYCSEEIAMTASVGDQDNAMDVLAELKGRVHEELGLVEGINPRPALPITPPTAKEEPKKEEPKKEAKKEEPKKEVKKEAKKEEPKKEVKKEVKKEEPKKEEPKKAPAKKALVLYKTGEEEGSAYATHTKVLLEIIGKVCTDEVGSSWLKNAQLKAALSSVSAELVGTELGKEAKNDLGFTVLPAFKTKATGLIKKVIASLPKEEEE